MVLEAIAIFPGAPDDSLTRGMEARSHLTDLKHLVSGLGGSLESQPVMAGQAGQISLALPTYPNPTRVQVKCHYPLLQQGFTQLVHKAGLVVDGEGPIVACITDNPTQLGSVPIVWVRHNLSPVPERAKAAIDFSTTPDQLRQVIDQVAQGQRVMPLPPAFLLSERELQVMRLLSQGKRDRSIAAELYISESTVKFHINNSLAKLNAKNRYQGVYQAAIRGWV